MTLKKWFSLHIEICVSDSGFQWLGIMLYSTLTEIIDSKNTEMEKSISDSEGWKVKPYMYN